MWDGWHCKMTPLVLSLKGRQKSLMLSAACCLQVIALSTLGFMSPWAGGRTDVTVTMDIDTGRGPKRGILQLMMEENPPHTVGLKINSKEQTAASFNWLKIWLHSKPVSPMHITFQIFVAFLPLALSPPVLHLSHLLQQTHQLRGCSFFWGQRMVTRNTSPMPCSPSWMKSASGRVRTQNGKRQPGTLL